MAKVSGPGPTAPTPKSGAEKETKTSPILKAQADRVTKAVKDNPALKPSAESRPAKHTFQYPATVLLNLLPPKP